MGREQAIRNWLLRGAAALSVAPLLVHAYMASFSRYIADDYCTLATLRRSGFWGSQRYWYENWSGRFSFTFLINLLELAGDWIVPVLPGVTILVWLGVSMIAVRQIIPGLPWSAAAGAAAFLLSATLAMIPNVYQSLYWQTGLVTYTAPLVILTALIAAAAWRFSEAPNRLTGLFATFVLVIAFISGGLTETGLSVQIAFFGLLFLYSLTLPSQARWNWLTFSTAGLVGSGAAGLVLTSAPGNEVRMGLLDQAPSMGEWARWTLRDTRLFIMRSLAGDKTLSVLVVAVPFLYGAVAGLKSRMEGGTGVRSRIEQLWPTLLVGGGALILITAGIAPSLYATANYPAERALIMPQYALSAGLILGALYAGKAVGNILDVGRTVKWVDVVLLSAVTLLLLYPIFLGVASMRSDLPQARTYARLWEERHEELVRAAGRDGQEVKVVSLPHRGGLAEIGYDSSEWINVCIADTYGLEAVVAK